MEKEYNTKYMYNVITERGTVLFESKEAAEEYCQLMKEIGIFASLNRWTWEVKIEK